ncbi:MarR family transcriptional regulator [Paenarthrobacter sp. PH39-S1]|uniref:MarR family winged helix-turn-helix transcriptional regulator n=1 Tax=Paenarthrobacter sp. PH39-S1 TaxID=3046204 RepID=UPI0024B9D664|nr:MarR family transcriptional regulator [Paenarthrobacter sp. PH39-S1]MDJ0357311.1 MarR family transcriptional regulator [Paenarthrobacter sp. PH39-S1]
MTAQAPDGRIGSSGSGSTRADPPGSTQNEYAPGLPASDSAGEDAVDAVELQLSLLWRRARAMSLNLSRSVHPELEPAAYGLLTILSRDGAMRLTELASCIGVGKPSVSRQVAFLESVGLVRKEADPLDGRAQLILLTDKGAEQMRTVHAARKEAFRRRLQHWSRPELLDLATLMAKLNEDYARDLHLRGPKESETPR